VKKIVCKKIAMVLAISAVGFLANSAPEIQKDLGFRYVNGKCVNSEGQSGLNPGFLGQCSDLRGVILSKFDLSGLDLSGSQMTNSDFQKSSFKSSNLTSVNFDSSNLNGVSFDSAKISAASFVRATLKNVTFGDADIKSSNFTEADFRSSDLSFVQIEKSDFINANFVGVPLNDALFTNCNFSRANLTESNLISSNFTGSTFNKAIIQKTKIYKTNFNLANIDEVDLSGNQITVSNFRKASLQKTKMRAVLATDSDFSEANMMGADITSADFSKAILGSTQLKDVRFGKRTKLPFTQEEALALGMIFKKSASIFILPDAKRVALDVFVRALTDMGSDVVVSAGLEYEFIGSESLANYDAVIHMNTNTYSNDIPATGQEALVNFVKAGGTFVYGEWNSYEFYYGGMQAMGDLMLFSMSDTHTGVDFDISPTSAALNTGIVDSLQFPLKLSKIRGYTTGNIRTFSENPVSILFNDSNNFPLIATRKVGQGKSVAFRFNCDSDSAVASCLGQPNYQKLMYNACNF
jgi:uncharacterized protein YjbI with pentapeptide repeats